MIWTMAFIGKNKFELIVIKVIYSITLNSKFIAFKRISSCFFGKVLERGDKFNFFFILNFKFWILNWRFFGKVFRRRKWRFQNFKIYCLSENISFFWKVFRRRKWRLVSRSRNVCFRRLEPRKFWQSQRFVFKQLPSC